MTRSDLEIWQHYVHRHINYHVAVLNKIDMLWDELRGELAFRATLHKQLEETARILKLPPSQVFAVSAQKALVGKIRQDAELISRSGIASLEHLLTEKIVPARRDILFQGAITQIAEQVESERSALVMRMREGLQTLKQLSELAGRNKEMAARLRVNLVKDKVRYDATAAHFKATRKAVAEHGDQLLERLSENALHVMLEEARAAMGDSWTTRGLIRAMRGLSEQAIQRFGQAEKLSVAMQQYLLAACERFHKEHGLPRMSIPVLDLTSYRLRMDRLMHETEEFCSDPANLLVEKHFMIRRFYNEVASETQKTFELASREAKRWLSIALDPVVQRIHGYKQILDERLQTLGRITDNVSGVQEQMELVKTGIDKLRRQKAELDGIARRFASV